MPRSDAFVDPRGQSGRPTNADRGTDLRNRAVPDEDRLTQSARRRGDALDFKPHYDDLSVVQTRIRSMFQAPTRGNVNSADLHTNDRTFANRTFKQSVSAAAREFGVPAGVLAEHLVAETRISSHLTPKTTATTPVSTTVLGLDDFVKERLRIDGMVPGAKGINGTTIDPMPAETDINKNILGQISDEELKKRAKPQLGFTFGEGVRATAAYLKYKEMLARQKVGDARFEALIPEVRAQLLRLLVNPILVERTQTMGGTVLNRRDTSYWLAAVKRGDLAVLFDFSTQTASESRNNVRRRATIHTARSVHAASTFFPESPF